MHLHLEDQQAADQHQVGVLYANDDNLLYFRDGRTRTYAADLTFTIVVV